MNFMPGVVCCILLMKAAHVNGILFFASPSDWKAGKVGTWTDTGADSQTPDGIQLQLGKPISKSAFNAMWALRMPFVKVGLMWER
jgi:hypothetical protein